MQGKEVSLFMGSVCHKEASNNDIPFVTIASCTEKCEKPFHHIHPPATYRRLHHFCAKTLCRIHISASYSNTCRFASFEFNTLPSVLRWESSDNNRWMTSIMEIPNWPSWRFSSNTDLEYIVSFAKTACAALSNLLVVKKNLVSSCCCGSKLEG